MALDALEELLLHLEAHVIVFTHALLEAMDKAPTDTNGFLDAKALFDYARDDVPRILEKLGFPKGAQHPDFFPKQPDRFPIWKR